MFVDDGFHVLEMNEEKMGTKHISKEINVVHIPTEKIQPNPYQPRKIFDEAALAELKESISEFGILQPLLVAQVATDKYFLIAGERRLRAAGLAGLKEVPVIISDYTEQQIAEIALIENLQREDLHYLEEAEGFEKLMTQFKLTQESLATRVGKKQSTIANKLRLLNLSEEVRTVLKDNKLTERHGRALLKLKEDEQRLEALKHIIKNQLNVRQTDAYIEKMLNNDKQKPQKRMIIVNDVRIYLNSLKQIANTIKNSGIPVQMDQELDGDDVVVTMRIKNTKKNTIVSAKK